MNQNNCPHYNTEIRSYTSENNTIVEYKVCPSCGYERDFKEVEQL